MSLNPACGDSTGSNRIEKGKVLYLLDLFEERWEKGQCDLVCGVLSDNWAMLVYVDVLFTCGECSFNSLESWSYSKEWMWTLGTQSIHSFIHEISAGWHSRNLILWMHCNRIITITLYPWPNG